MAYGFKTGGKDWGPNNPPPPGTGRHSCKTRAIEIIFRVFNQHGIEGFEAEMIKQCQADPVTYYNAYIKPLQPVIHDIDDDSKDRLGELVLAMRTAAQASFKKPKTKKESSK